MSMEEALTPNEMRRALAKKARSDATINKVATLAELQGFSGEDKFVAMAYYLSLDKEAYLNRILDMANMSTPAPVILVSREDLEDQMKKFEK